MSKSTMEIKFEGKSHQISAELLIASLVNYQTVIEIANRMLGQGERKIDVKVNATKEGSFVLDISLEQTIIESLFSNDSVSYLANLTTVVGGVYGLYKVFRGRKINESDKIPNNLGIKKEDLNITVNVYNVKESRRCISETIKKVKDESQSEGISYSFGIGDDVQYKREDFEKLIYDDFDLENEKEEMYEDVDAILNIVSLSFSVSKPWNFLYNGFPIRCTLRDETFQKHIDSGASFAKGDSLKVKLRIFKYFDKEYNTYVNKSYKVLEITEHIHQPKQITFNFEQEE